MDFKQITKGLTAFIIVAIALLIAFPSAGFSEGLPLDKYGRVDWVKLVDQGLIAPRWSLDPKADPDDEEREEIIIYFVAKGRSMNDVLYPHDIHTYWLKCDICHDTKGGAIFNQEAGSNNVTMRAMIGENKWCGRCHDKVAFPLADCPRCHTIPKGSDIKEEWTLRTSE